MTISTPRVARLALTPFVLAAPALVAGCGAGTAGIVAGSGDSGSGNSAPALANLQVPVSKTAPARIQVELSDREGESVRLELSARVPLAGGGLGAPELLTAVSGPGFPANGAVVAIPGGGPPLALELEWRFTDETFLPDDGRFVEGVQLLARLANGAELVLGDDEPFSLGNDAPVVTAAAAVVDPIEGEAAGIVRVVVTVADSSDDVVSVRPEFDVQGDVPDAGWRPATGFGLTDVQVSRTGTTLDFFWDTDADLHDLEREVALRFTPVDQAPAVGASFVSAPFRVDNNEEPIVQLDSGPLVLNPDGRRGIPIPFRVFDEEQDPVEVVFQWRRASEEFPALPREGAALDAILADPAQRLEHHVCTPYPRYAHGRVEPIDGRSIRLPELASSESWALASGLEGRMLELLRGSSTLEVPVWAVGSTTLGAPVAALPLGDGSTALVLDRQASGRLFELDLANGSVAREIAGLGTGVPTAMALERGARAALVALESGGAWHIARVELESGAVAQLISSDGAHPGPVRGMASVGSTAAVLAVGATLLRLDYCDPLAPRVGSLLTNLAAPWGVVVDPSTPGRIYFSERDAGRIGRLDLTDLATTPLALSPSVLALVEAPEALALEPGRLLVLTRSSGASEVVALQLPDGAEAVSMRTPSGSSLTSLSTGPNGLRLACSPASGEMLVGGGVEQRRRIVAHARTSQVVSVEPDFEPAPRAGGPWRVSATAAQGTPGGTDTVFVWDSRDAPVGLVQIKGTPRDDEVGVPGLGTSLKEIRSAFEAPSLALVAPPPNLACFEIADLDGDGDKDIAAAGNDLRVYFQTAQGKFDAPPLVLGSGSFCFALVAADLDGDGDADLASCGLVGVQLWFQTAGTFTPALVLPGSAGGILVSLAAGDLDGDGDTDLVAADRIQDSLELYFQLAPGLFQSAPTTYGDSVTTDQPECVDLADLDGDGDLDLVSANWASHSLTVFTQVAPGAFASKPLVLDVGAVSGSVAAVDIDGDGDCDLVSANQDQSVFLTVFFQGPCGLFVEGPLVLRGLPTSLSSFVVRSADLDGDGDQDLAVAQEHHSPNEPQLLTFMQESPRHFSGPFPLGGFADIETTVSTTVADIDGNGSQDLVIGANGDAPAEVYLHGVVGEFAGSPSRLTSLEVDGPNAVSIADLDGDGDLDVACANGFLFRGTVVLFFQDAPGVFRSSALSFGSFFSSPSPTIALPDVDGDGDLDIMVADDSRGFALFHQVSPGVFDTDPLRVPAGPSPSSVAAADVDGDGAVDLVSANRGGNNITLLFQTAPSTYDVRLTLGGGAPVTLAPTALAIADLDGNGRQDVICANSGSNDLTAFLQQSPRSFQAVTLGGPGTTVSPNSVAIADLDGDGDLDVASANGGGNDLTVFFQAQPGVFPDEPLVLGGAGRTRSPASVVAADFDNDGDVDIASANRGGNDLTLFRQTVPGRFSQTPRILGGPGQISGPASLATADIDGDGDADLVSANQASEDLSIFWGGR